MNDAVLATLGFDDRRRIEIEQRGLAGECGRVVRVDRSVVSVVTANGSARIETAPNDELVVGDWVVLGEQKVERLERRTELVRRAGANKDERQSMAANIDLVLIVRALDSEVRINRLTALLVVAYDSGATPVVVLTKADLRDNAASLASAVSQELGGIEAITISARTGAGLDELRRRIVGQTIVLFGESGAGKSTLTNVLCGQELLATGEVRRDGQGRHTTTHRELVVVPSGGVIIDTPGIRDVAAYGDGDGVALAFADVVALASNCRFSDCSHEATPGCALAAALEAGTIDQRRVDAFLHESREQAWLVNRLSERGEVSNAKSRRSVRRPRNSGPRE